MATLHRYILLAAWLLAAACSEQPSAVEDDSLNSSKITFRLTNCAGDTTITNAEKLSLSWDVKNVPAGDSVVVSYRPVGSETWLDLGSAHAYAQVYKIALSALDGDRGQFRLRLLPTGMTLQTGIVSYLNTAQFIQLRSPSRGDLLRTGDSVFLGWDFNPVSAGQDVRITLRRVLDGFTNHLGRYRIGDGAAAAVLPQIPAGEVVIILENLTTRKTREFDGMYAHGIRLRGFENVNVLYRGYGHSFTCEQDWPPELNPKPTLQLSYATDGGMNWVFWRRDLQANFIDLHGFKRRHHVPRGKTTVFARRIHPLHWTPLHPGYRRVQTSWAVGAMVTETGGDPRPAVDFLCINDDVV